MTEILIKTVQININFDLIYFVTFTINIIQSEAKKLKPIYLHYHDISNLINFGCQIRK